MNAVFDSGTTYTYIPARIYNPFVHTVFIEPQCIMVPMHLDRDTGHASHGIWILQVKLMIGSSHSEVHDHELPHCWKFKSIDEVKRLFKPLSLQFDNKIAMHIPAMNYLVHTVNL